MRARYAIVVVPLASLALAACGGSSDSNAVATADSAGISSPAGSETSDGDAVTTIVSATNVSETSSPPSPGPFDDPWAAVTLVDGLAYNLCSLVPENSLASPDVEEPRQMGLHELTGSAVSYTHLRAHETVLDLVCRLLLEKKKKRTSLCRFALLRYR